MKFMRSMQQDWPLQDLVSKKSGLLSSVFKASFGFVIFGFVVTHRHRLGTDSRWYIIQHPLVNGFYRFCSRDLRLLYRAWATDCVAIMSILKTIKYFNTDIVAAEGGSAGWWL